MRRTTRDGNGTGGWIAQAELLKLQKSGQFPDESVRRKDTHIHYVKLPDVLGISVIKEITLEGRLL